MGLIDTIKDNFFLHRNNIIVGDNFQNKTEKKKPISTSQHIKAIAALTLPLLLTFSIGYAFRSLDWVSQARKCIGKEDEVCQAKVTEAFQRFLENDSYSSINHFAGECVGKVDQACQYVLNNAFPKLFEVIDTAESGYGNNYSFGAYYMTKQCMKYSDQACQSLVKKGFFEFLKVNTYLATNLAEECIDKTNAVCQEIIQVAYPRLLEVDFERGQLFGVTCEQTGEACKSILKESLLTYLENCFLNTTQVCKRVVDKFYETYNFKPIDL